jgi:hypothetical protein
MAIFKGLNYFQTFSPPPLPSLGVPTLILPPTLILQAPGPWGFASKNQPVASGKHTKNELENGGLMVI